MNKKNYELSNLRDSDPSRETKFSGANADREIFTFTVQLTTSRISNLIRLIHTLAICDDHTYIYIVLLIARVNEGDQGDGGYTQSGYLDTSVGIIPIIVEWHVTYRRH